jgi:hypothetical protein
MTHETLLDEPYRTLHVPRCSPDAAQHPTRPTTNDE